MKWKGRSKSGNVVDRRGKRAVGLGVGGILIAIIAILLGGDPQQVLDMFSGGTQPSPAQTEQQDELSEFVSVVLKDCEDVWNTILEDQTGVRYEEPKLVLFSGKVRSACGLASAASGPFYCPGDQQIYIDLSFCNELKTRFGAPGDFAVAYVIAHEVGHHIQYLMGTTQEMQKQRGRLSKEEYNKLSVRLELQADFLAGVWAHHADKMKDILERGDIQEALNAANAIGDDRLQKQSQGYVVPDAFTHGTSEQRMRWFRKGYESGRFRDGNTFSTDYL